MVEAIRPVGDIERAARAVGFEINSAAGDTPGSITGAISLGPRGVELLLEMSRLEGMKAAFDYVSGSDIPIIDALVEKYRYAVRPPYSPQVGSVGVTVTVPLGR